MGRLGYLPFQPCLDGVFIVDNHFLSDIDILTGVTKNEFTLFSPPMPSLLQLVAPGPTVADVSATIEKTLGPEQMDCSVTSADATKIIHAIRQVYKVSKGIDIQRCFRSNVVFDAPLVTTVNQLAECGNRVYVYRNDVGPGHAGELGYIFGTWNHHFVVRLLSGLPMKRTDSSDALGAKMEHIWGCTVGSFAKTGIPVTLEGSPWPTYSGTSRVSMKIGPSGTHASPAFSVATHAVHELVLKAKRPFGIKLRLPKSKL